jgi:D-beta-D-heptose 7-phosphate kinase/D-beta-D-heptose 1-phosphate adenosyltransferase
MSNLLEVVTRLGSPRLVVLGDLMLDRFVWGNAERVSPEAPALVLRRQRMQECLGGAGSVALMARTLGAEVRLAGVVGDDENSCVLYRLLDEAGIDCEGVLHEPSRPTTVKERFLAGTRNGPMQQLLRADHESRVPIHPGTARRLARQVMHWLAECDALLIEDHGKGVCSSGLLAEIIAAARERRVPVLADPACGVDLDAYRGADLLLPNRKEAALALVRDLWTASDGLEAARELVKCVCRTKSAAPCRSKSAALVVHDSSPQRG